MKLNKLLVSLLQVLDSIFGEVYPTAPDSFFFNVWSLTKPMSYILNKLFKNFNKKIKSLICTSNIQATMRLVFLTKDHIRISWGFFLTAFNKARNVSVFNNQFYS